MSSGLQTSSGFGTQRSTQQSRTRVIPTLLQGFNKLLGMNEQGYSNLLSGYAQAQQTLHNELAQTYAGYAPLEGRIAHTLGVDGGGWGVATPAAQQIQQNLAATQGQTQQDLINRGLGNSTVLSQMRTANTLAGNQALGGLGAQLAQTYAGYQGQIGLAGLAARMQGSGLEENLASGYLSDLAHYQFSNTMGNLTGQFSRGQSQGMNQSQSMGQQVNPPVGGGYGGGGMPAMETAGAAGGGYYDPNLATLYGANAGGPGSGAITGVPVPGHIGGGSGGLAQTDEGFMGGGSDTNYNGGSAEGNVPFV